MSRLSLRRTLTLAMLGLALLPLVVAGTLSFVASALKERDSQLLLYERRATRLATEIGHYLAELDASLASLGRYRDVLRIEADDRGDMFATLIAQQPAITEVLLLDATRQVLTHRLARSPLPGPDALGWLKPAELDAAARAGQALMGRVDFDDVTGEPEFALIRPLVGLRSGALEGFLVARCRPVGIWEIVERVARGTPDEAMVLDADGRMIAHRDPSVVLQGHHVPPAAATGVGQRADGHWVVTGTNVLRSLGRELHVRVSVPVRTAFAGSLQLLVTFVAITVLTLVGATVLTLWLRRRILRPVNRLTAAAQRLHGGDWTTRVEVPGEDELGQLAITFNEMAAQLRAVHQGLEDRIAERTAELARARDEAEAASRSKSEFLSRMSHELRTPMNAILGFGQLLAADDDRLLDDRRRAYVNEILQAGSHLLALINDVLDLARVEAGKLPVSLEPVHLPALVQDCLAMLLPLARERRVSLPDAPPADCDVHVQADRTRIKQVLLNLLSNAIKYDREGGQVTLACRPEGSTVRLSVSDTGPGLTEAQQARLFRDFERLDADEAAVEGAGIGLALSRRLVLLMGGEIGVESRVGEGSTFWVRLGRAEAPAVAAPAPPGAGDRGAVRTVLYIEDNPVNMLLMQAMLERQSGLRLLQATLPGPGLETARTERPDLILLDIQLPEMDGFEVLRRLRADQATASIPVIAISANATRVDLARGRVAGFDDYLTKPLDMKQVLAAIDRALGRAGPG